MTIQLLGFFESRYDSVKNDHTTRTVKTVHSPMPQMNGEDMHLLMSWWFYRILHFSSQVNYQGPGYENRICLRSSTWVAWYLPEVRMPSDISDCKRKNQCFKTRIRNDFTEECRRNSIRSTGHHKDVRDKTQKCIQVEHGPEVEFFFFKIYVRVIRGSLLEYKEQILKTI